MAVGGADAKAGKTLPRSAGAVVFRRGDHGARILLLGAGERWDFPKGPVEDGESEQAAARREVWERTGIAVTRFAFDEDFRETLPYAGSEIARYYAAEAETDAVTPPAGQSPDAWQWASLDEAEELLPPRLAVVLEWTRGLLES